MHPFIFKFTRISSLSPTTADDDLIICSCVTMQPAVFGSAFFLPSHHFPFSALQYFEHKFRDVHLQLSRHSALKTQCAPEKPGLRSSSSSNPVCMTQSSFLHFLFGAQLALIAQIFAALCISPTTSPRASCTVVNKKEDGK